jgi:hypothetical protein
VQKGGVSRERSRLATSSSEDVRIALEKREMVRRDVFILQFFE